MRKIILSALAGALCMFLILLGVSSFITTRQSTATEYTHVDFISKISQKDCFLCGTDSSTPLYPFWGEDNVGIINLNTFEFMRLEINRYDNQGQLIEKAAGYIQPSILSLGDTNAYAYTYPNTGCSHVQITGVQYSINREFIQSRLCQSCLDTINSLWFSGNAPAEYAVISFAAQTIRPLLKCTPWFSAGNYGINCDFRDNGAIDLLIHYCPNRYND